MQYRKIDLPMSRKCNNKYFVTIDIAIKPSASETGWIKSGIIVGIMALDGDQIEWADYVRDYVSRCWWQKVGHNDVGDNTI